MHIVKNSTNSLHLTSKTMEKWLFVE